MPWVKAAGLAREAVRCGGWSRVGDKPVLENALAPAPPERKKEKSGLRTVAPGAVDELLNRPAILGTTATGDAQPALVAQTGTKAVECLRFGIEMPVPASKSHDIGAALYVERDRKAVRRFGSNRDRGGRMFIADLRITLELRSDGLDD